MQLNFNAYEYDPTQGATVCFPLADYNVEITNAEAKTVKDNMSEGYIELSLTVVDGNMRGLIQKDRLNLWNQNETAKRIAHSNLAAYCFAINRPYIQDSSQMIGGRLICTIGPQDSNGKYSEVKVIKCPDGSLPTRPQQQQGAPAPPAQAPPAPPPSNVAAAPPWANASQAAPAAPAVQSGIPANPPWGNAQPGAPAPQSSPNPPWVR